MTESKSTKIHPNPNQEPVTIPFGTLPIDHTLDNDISVLLNETPMDGTQGLLDRHASKGGSDNSTKMDRGDTVGVAANKLLPSQSILDVTNIDRSQSALELVEMKQQPMIVGMTDVDQLVEMKQQSMVVADDQNGMTGFYSMFSSYKNEQKEKKHEASRLESQNNQCSTAKEFMEKVKYSIQLDKLYEVVGSCQFTDGANYCPVLVRIVDAQILELNGGMPYLLQVWDSKGQMIYERKMAQPCSNWSINHSTLVFQEDSKSKDVYLVQLFLNKSARVFRFTLSNLPTETISTKYEGQKFVVPGETHLKSSIIDNELLKRQRADHAAFQGENAYVNFNEKFSDRRIVRAPDSMIDFIDGHIVLAFHQKIFYSKVSEYLLQESDLLEHTRGVNGDGLYFKIVLQEQDINSADVMKNFKIITFSSMTKDLSTVVLENLHSRELKFYGLSFEQNMLRLSDYAAERDNMEQVGACSPLLKFRSVSKLAGARSMEGIDHKESLKNKKYQISIAVRKNGAFEVYYDFQLSYVHFDPSYQCIDVETDYNQFYLDFVKIIKGERKPFYLDYEKDFELRQVRHLWRNKTKMDTTKIVNRHKWAKAIQYRIAKFFNLYSSVINFDTLTIVAHRNMITIQNMKLDEEQLAKKGHHTEPLGGHIREMVLKKRSKAARKDLLDKKKGIKLLSSYESYQILALIGTTNIESLQIQEDGSVVEKNEVTCPERILSFKDDHKNHMGLLLMTDGPAAQLSEYTEHEGNSIYTHPYSLDNPSAVTKIMAFKGDQFFTLVSTSELQSVQFDSFFDVVKVNRSFFQAEKSQFAAADDKEVIDPLEKHYKDDQIRVIYISSQVTGIQTLHPLVKKKDEDGNLLDMILIREVEKKFSTSESMVEAPHELFSIRNDEFDENTDSIVIIGYNQVTIYDKNLEPRFTFKGLKIRQAQAIHQSYLYMICDMIAQKWTITDHKEGTTKKPDLWRFTASGFYILDLIRLFKGKVEKYKMLSNVGGFANKINNSIFTDRLTIVQTFSLLTVIPFPHLNLINCVGMGQKSQYLIWREKNGFFSALDKEGVVTTWSLIDGRFLYQEKFNQSLGDLSNFQVFRSADDDITYTRDFYQLEDESISLIQSTSSFKENHPDNEACLRVPILQLVDSAEDGAGESDNIFQINQYEHLQKKEVQQKKYHHYKVLGLKTHEDTLQGSNCELRFQFIFEKYQNVGQNSKIFDWHSETPVQRLYLSRDTKYLMEVINEFIATIYEREEINPAAKLCKWKRLYRIKSYPRNLMSHTSVPFLFSPNFKYVLDFNYRQKYFYIMNTNSQDVHIVIPKDLLNTDWNRIVGQSAIKIITSRFSWIDDDTFRIVNEVNLDCIFNIKKVEVSSPENPEIKVERTFLELASCVKVDNLILNMNKRNVPHVLLDPNTLETRDTLERLIRLNQRYKVSLQHAINLGRKDFKLLTKINSIDYSQPWKHAQSHFDVQLTFTWLDWYIAQLVVNDDIFDLENIDEEQQIQLCFNIMPKGRSVLHLLALGGQRKSHEEHGSKIGDQRVAFQAASELFQVASIPSQVWIVGEEEEAGSTFEVPILPDMYGFTALDICMGIEELKFANYDIFKNINEAIGSQQETDSKKVDVKTQNLAMAVMIFQNLSNYGFMHSSFQITESLLEAIRIALPEISTYLDSRFKDADHVFQVKTQGSLKAMSVKKCAAYGEYASTVASAWTPESLVSDEVFEDNGALATKELKYIDIPYLYTHNEIGNHFIDALDECPDIEINSLAAVQILVDKQHKFWQNINYFGVGLPIAIQLMVFWYWSNVVLPNRTEDSDDFKSQESACVVLLNIFSAYLILLEVSALMIRRLRFFKSLTKVVNLITPCVIIYQSVDGDLKSEVFWENQTIAALLIWLRFLLFMRSIPVFSYLIRMITASIYDMATFFVVLIVGVIAFADAFLSIDQILVLRGDIESRELPENPSIYEKYFKVYILAWQASYATALGEFYGNVEFYRELDWFIWFLCTIFNLVLLFNLLIAIISKTFEEIDSTSVQTEYKEKVIQIRNLQDSMLGGVRDDISPTKLLFVTREANTEETQDSETTAGIAALDEKMTEMKEEIIQFTDGALTQMYTSFSGQIQQSFSGLRRKQSKKEKAKMKINLSGTSISQINEEGEEESARSSKFFKDIKMSRQITQAKRF